MKNKELHNHRRSGFKVPDNYFSTIESNLVNELKLKTTVDDTGYKLPIDYFETFDTAVLSRLKAERESKVLSLFPFKKVLAFTAVAASLIVLFGVVFTTDKSLSFDALETVAIEDYLEDEDYTNYEFALLLSEDELTRDNFTDAPIPKEDLADYLLNHSDLEDLIID